MARVLLQETNNFSTLIKMRDFLFFYLAVLSTITLIELDLYGSDNSNKAKEI